MASERPLTKVHVDLPNHWAISGESMWARPLLGGAYEIRNVPFYAYNLNFLDVVEAIAAKPAAMPSIRRVIRRSGHRTLRVIFDDSVPEAERIPMLETLRPLGASIEGATKKLFAIDVQPAGDYEAIMSRLDDWTAAEQLEYETCEARVEGSFDDVAKDAG